MSVDDVLDELTQEAIDSPELQELAKTNRGVKALVDAAQKALGKPMTDEEIEILEETEGEDFCSSSQPCLVCGRREPRRDVTITQKEACDTAHDVMTDAERGLAEERIEEACFCCKQCCVPDSVEITMGPADESRYPYKPDYAVSPGKLIRSYMEEKGWNRIDLRSAIGLPEGHVGLLLGGDLAVTPRLAEKLHDIFGPSVQFWLNAEANYRVTLARLEREKAQA